VHGSAAFFVIPQSLNSSNVDGRAAQPAQVGGSRTSRWGGPLVRNRVWLFGAYRRVQEDQTVNNAQVPLQRARQPDLHQGHGGGSGATQRFSASFQWDRTNAINAVLRTTGTGAPRRRRPACSSATPALALAFGHGAA